MKILVRLNREVDELRENVAYNQVPNPLYQEYADVAGKSAGDPGSASQFPFT